MPDREWAIGGIVCGPILALAELVRGPGDLVASGLAGQWITGRIMKREQKLSVLNKRSMSGLISTLFVAVMLIFGAAFVACGDGNDDPADCTTDQYYNEASGRCTICPAVQEPECREGCGFSIERDERSCPVAVCSATCDLCADGEVFSDELLSCIASE